MEKNNASVNSMGKYRFEGYVIDILDAFAKRANFDYDLHLVKDNLYGRKQGGKWTGMIGELVEDVCIPRTINFYEPTKGGI